MEFSDKISQMIMNTSAESHAFQKPRQLCVAMRRERILGFTLVEVVLALGLCSFALLSLMALMPVSLDSARHALEISRVAKAFQKVTSELTQSKFANVAAMSTSTYQFDYDGNKPASDADIYYTVLATVAASPVPNQSSTSLVRVTLEAQTRRETNAASTTITICDMGY
jgi:uncharacterized protein (TIGR02598 family)